MKSQILLVALAGAGLLCDPIHSPAQEPANRDSLETPTHQEIEPIRVPLGNEGHLTTIALDRKGNVLVGVSWAPAEMTNSSKPKLDLPSAPTRILLQDRPAADAKATMALINEAVGADTPEGWDNLIKEVSAQEFRAAMSTLEPPVRRATMMSLPDWVRERFVQGMRGLGGPRGRRGRGGPGDRMSDERGGLLPQLTLGDDNHLFAVKTVDPAGNVLATWPMSGGLQPKAIHACEDGTVYVAGGGKLALLSEDGTVRRLVDTDFITGQKSLASGLDASGQYVFVAFGMGNSLRATEDIYRFQRDLTEPKKIIER